MKLKSPDDEQMRQNFRAIEQADDENHKRGRDIEVAKNKLILTSPDGSRFSITVSNAGLLGTVKL